jgi:hypothetical protein
VRIAASRKSTCTVMTSIRHQAGSQKMS